MFEVDILDVVDELIKFYFEKVLGIGEYVFFYIVVLDNVLLLFGKVVFEIVLRRCSRRCFYELIRMFKIVNNDMELVILFDCFYLLVERFL